MPRRCIGHRRLGVSAELAPVANEAVHGLHCGERCGEILVPRFHVLHEDELTAVN